MDHLHKHTDILLSGRAQIMLEVALPLQLENHFLNRRTLPADAAEFVPQGMGFAPQGILDK